MDRSIRRLGLFLIVRGAPALLVYRGLPHRSRAALAILQCTALPLLVVITEIGLETGHMKPENAAALVGAGMLSVLVLPLWGFAVLGDGAERSGSSSVVDGRGERPTPSGLPLTE